MSERVTVSIPQINLDDYEITKYIGRDFFSVICKAIDKKTKKEVVIKEYMLKESDLEKI